MSDNKRVVVDPAIEASTGDEAVKAFLRRPGRLSCDDGSGLDYRLERGSGGSVLSVPFETPPKTDAPALYRRETVRERLLPVLAALPREFFERITTERNLAIIVTASPWGFSADGPFDEIDPGSHGSRTLRVEDVRNGTGQPAGLVVRLGRMVWEAAPPAALVGIVVHELCHVYIGHPEGDDATDSDETIQWREDEVVALACQIGFRAETAAYLDFYQQLEPGIMGRLPA